MTTRATSGPCALCGAACPVRFVMGAFSIHRCAACDFEFVHPVPAPEVLAAVYARGYFSGPGAGYTDYFGAERAVTQAKARTRIARLEQLGARPAGAWLDIGCADGGFVAAARAQGFRA